MKNAFRVIALIIGILGGIYSGMIIYNDMHPQSLFSDRYNYQPPLSDHEITMMCIFSICVIMAICGLIGLISSLTSSKEK